ncbi:hypothetical protein [Agromyces marinus]|uniref:Uncharacterized protein n=1 Tax=Agromyces marinus TaxID=1389020 RepID=A0ABM8H0P5_9MICO|nr:hypothetical protein [Agromyces marinus]UIP57543.1 hypothetical protein DSM26151_04070 [Agromyces marinus]BDZ54316.1 hypothetical protein GCM10025870_13890 [Agromyces marinus]
MDHPAADPDRGPASRGRRAAPRNTANGPLGRALARASDLLVSVLAAIARIGSAIASLKGRMSLGAVRTWIAVHRVLALVVVALVVSGAAFAGTAALIGRSAMPAAEGDGASRPAPQRLPPEQTEPTAPVAPVAPNPPPSTAPATPPPAPAADPGGPADPAAPEPADDPPAVTEEPPEPTEEPEGNGRPDPPGAANRPDKKKD